MFVQGTVCKRQGCETRTRNQSKRTASRFSQNENETRQRNEDLFALKALLLVLLLNVYDEVRLIALRLISPSVRHLGLSVGGGRELILSYVHFPKRCDADHGLRLELSSLERHDRVLESHLSHGCLYTFVLCLFCSVCR